MAIHHTPRATTRPKPAAMPAVHPIRGRFHGTCAAVLRGSEGIDTGSMSLVPTPGVPDAPPAVIREFRRCDTLALPRQDHRSGIRCNG